MRHTSVKRLFKTGTATRKVSCSETPLSQVGGTGVPKRYRFTDWTKRWEVLGSAEVVQISERYSEGTPEKCSLHFNRPGNAGRYILARTDPYG